MSTNTHQNRNRVIAGVVILIVLLTVVFYVANNFLPTRMKSSQIHSRFPISELTYCSIDQSQLCVISFGQELNGPMHVDFLVPDSDYPEFLLKIDHNGIERIYECQHLEEIPEKVYCTGEVQAPGAVLKISVFSRSNNLLLTKGTFSVIGIAILTPEFVPESTEEPIEGLTSRLGSRIPDAPKRSQPPVHPSPSSVPTGPTSRPISSPTPAPTSRPTSSPGPTSYPNPSSYP